MRIEHGQTEHFHIQASQSQEGGFPPALPFSRLRGRRMACLVDGHKWRRGGRAWLWKINRVPVETT
jgi:hypothetical protein